MLRKGSHKREEFFGTQHRFEHWYRDNTIYFVTARCRHRTPAFATEECKSIFWDRFTHYTADLERALHRALEIKAFLENVPYKRYLRRRAQP